MQSLGNNGNWESPLRRVDPITFTRRPITKGKNCTFMPTRRQTLLGVTGAAVAAAGGASWLLRSKSFASPTVSSDQSLFKAPSLNAGAQGGAETIYDLQLQSGVSNFFSDVPTPTIGINQAYLGPTLEMRSGERVKLNVHNTLDESATVHWHGFHLPARFDGTPHQAIGPGETWTAQFEVRQRGGLFWYHSHAHKRSGSQVYRGLAGPIYVRDAESDELGLPSEYGVTDLPLIIQDRAFQRDGQLIYGQSMHTVMMGMTGDTLLVNGVIDPAFEYTADLLRLRLLNGSNARIYKLEFTDGRSVRQIASDGGLLEAPVPVKRVVLSPGERAEILVDLSDGQSAQLVAYPVENTMMGGRMMRGRMRGRQISETGSGFNVLALVPVPVRRAFEPVPSKLLRLPAPDPTVAVRTRKFVMNMPMGMMGGGFTINGKVMDMDRIDERVKINTSEIWQIENASMMAHPFHIHDVQFRILDRNSRPPSPAESGLKDTVLVGPGETVRLLLAFADYSDADIPYMYHCHILEHEDAGMMGQFTVED